MAHIKYLSNRAYISGNLKEILCRFEMYRYNFICAPTGYGKSMVCKTFFKNYPAYTVLWIDANSSKEIFWNNFCNVVKILNPSYAAMFKNIGFPDSEEDVNTIINYLSMINQEKNSVLVIIDNFDEMLDDNISRILAASYSSCAIGIKYLFLVRKLTNQNIINMIAKGNALSITKKELAFSQEDIEDYFRLNEIVIDKDTSNNIFNKTLGWPYIVYLYKEAYKSKSASIDEVMDKAIFFIENNIWLKLNKGERDFLADMSVFDNFTLSQCIRQTSLDEKKCLEYLNSITFIDYDVHSRKYRFNPIFDNFILRILEEKTVDEIRNITLRAADSNLDDGDYFNAMVMYSKSKEYQKIYLSHVDFVKIYPYIIKNNKDVFTDIANHYWDIKKEGNYDFSIIICFSMLLLNVNNMVHTLLTDIETDINNDPCLSEAERISYIAELQYIRAFTNYNDFEKMNTSFNQISSITKSPVSIIAGNYPFNFDCPSIISLYHREAGCLDKEMSMLEQCAPEYYRITNGHGKGFEAVMKAEVLYNRGELDSAEILCHKAIYMADSRNQYGIYIAANYILANIALHRGLNDEYKEYTGNIREIAVKDNLKSMSLGKMTDICMACIYCNIDEKDKIASWLKDEKTIEDTVNFFSLSFVNSFYSKYLILTGDYHHFLGISGQLLGLNKLFSYVVPMIYTYIFLAIANNENGDTDKAHKFMLEALNLAVKDRLHMPFVYNYSLIEDILNETAVNKELSSFIKGIARLSKGYEKGVRAIKKAGHILADYGLTSREADVAKLAAQRLSNKEIAEQLFIAESTVKSNMKVIFNKLQINSRSELKKFFE